jgi:hypothetical protein
VTTGDGVVSCLTASTCRCLSRDVCAGESNLGVSPPMDMSARGGFGMLVTCWSCVPRCGDVGGVKNSLSLELSSTGPMTSGHLQSHFHTAVLTRVTSKGAMLRTLKVAEEEESKRRNVGKHGSERQVGTLYTLWLATSSHVW